MADTVHPSALLLTGSTDPVRRLSPEQDFRLCVARNDLQQAHEMDVAGVSAAEVAQLAGALRSSLFNALAIIDTLTGEQL